MKSLIILLFVAVLGSAATFYYIYANHADETEQALMRDTLTTYAPFLEEYVNP